MNWRRELKEFQKEWTKWWSDNDLGIRRPSFRIIHRPSLPMGRTAMDDAEIELLEGMLDQRDRTICRMGKEIDRLDAELRRSEQQKERSERKKNAILADREREYKESRSPEDDERIARMLRENHPGTGFH